MPGAVPSGLPAAALDAMSDAILVTDAVHDPPGPRIVYVNAAWEQMTGYRGEEVLGRTPRLLQGSDTDASVTAAVRADLEAGRSGSGQVVNYRRDGSPFHLHMDVSPIRDAAGAVTHYVAVQRDVTERARIEAELNQLDRVARLQHDIATTDLDIDSQRQRVAEVALSIAGGDAAAVGEVEGDAIVYRTVAGTAAGYAGVRLPIDNSLAGLVFTRREAMIVRDLRTDERPTDRAKALQGGFISGVLVPLLHNGICYGVLNVFAGEPDRFGDAERELLEVASSSLAVSLANAAAYERQVERRNILLDALPTLIAYLDTQWRYVDVNAAYEKRFGVPAAAIRGKHIWDMVDAESFERIKPQMAAAFAGEFVSYRTDVTLSTGEVRTLQPEYRPHIDKDGRVQGIYAMVHDLTDSVQANADYLTGLANRRSFTGQAEPLLESARRYEKPLSAVLVDIDHFKTVNDRHGHDMGDAVLKAVAGVLRQGSRSADLVARWGGEEFVLLLPETAAEAAAGLADRLRAAVAELGTIPGATVTISAGVASLAGEDTLESLVGRADERLYAAKEAGRNRVVGAAPEAA